MPDRRIRDLPGLAGPVRTAGVKQRRRAALAVGSAALSAVVVVGVAGCRSATSASARSTARSASTRTMPTTPTSASHCNPRTDILESRTNSGANAWTGYYCGTGYRHLWHVGNYWQHIDVIWDATAPYHRVWFHIYGKPSEAWCAWGPSHTVVPMAFRAPGNVLITSNTSPCPGQPATSTSGHSTPTAAGAPTTATSASPCNPRTDILESRTNSGANAWAGYYCGTGYRHLWHVGNYWEHINVIWDATAPYHRVWLHIYGKPSEAWCAWGPSHTVVPMAFRAPGNVLITSNTAPCPGQ